MIFILAISTGGEGKATPMAATAAAAAAAAGVGRRASIIHSADNQKSWKHTFMRRPRGTAESGWRGDRATRVVAVACRYKYCERDVAAAAARYDKRYSSVEMPPGVERRDEGEGDPRNQDDNRRVGAVMHDAQIRAIIPITVQIIVRELVAANAFASAETQPNAMLHSEPQRHEFESISAGERGWVEANFGCDFGLEIAGTREVERRHAFETGISTWQLRFDSSTDNVAVSPRCNLDCLEH